MYEDESGDGDGDGDEDQEPQYRNCLRQVWALRVCGGSVCGEGLSEYGG